MSPQFILQIRDRFLGPFNRDEVLTFFKKQQIGLHDFIFDLSKRAWSLLGDHEYFSHILPTQPPILIEPRNIYLYANGRSQGPLTHSEVIQKLQGQEISLFDFICFEGQLNKWVRIKDHLQFLESVPRLPTSPPPAQIKTQLHAAGEKTNLVHLAASPELESTAEESASFALDKDLLVIEEIALTAKEREAFTQSDSAITLKDDKLIINNEAVWIVLKNEDELGPFRYADILKMLQKGVINKSCSLKKSGERRWRSVGDLREFDAGVMRKILANKDKNLSEIFVARKYKRSSYIGPATVTTSDAKVHHGTCSSVSEGGCFVEMRIAGFKMGEHVDVRIMPGTVRLIVDAQAEVVSLQERVPRGIGLRFVNLSDEQKKQLRHFVEEFAQSQ